MPKCYSDQEREYIKKRLKEEAAACMGQFGIRRTTVDELVKRVNIPKGTFYLFYKSKELLLFDVIQEQHELVNQKLYQAISEVADQSFTAEKLTDTIQKMFALLPVKKEADVKVMSAAFHAIYYATLHKKDIGEEGYDQALRMLIYGVVTQII